MTEVIGVFFAETKGKIQIKGLLSQRPMSEEKVMQMEKGGNRSRDSLRL